MLKKKKGKKEGSTRWEETDESRRYRDCIHGGKPDGKQGVEESAGRGKCLGQRGVINKSVNDVSGLMLVVTRSLGLDRGGGITQRPIEEFHPLSVG